MQWVSSTSAWLALSGMRFLAILTLLFLWSVKQLAADEPGSRVLPDRLKAAYEEIIAGLRTPAPTLKPSDLYFDDRDQVDPIPLGDVQSLISHRQQQAGNNPAFSDAPPGFNRSVLRPLWGHSNFRPPEPTRIAYLNQIKRADLLGLVSVEDFVVSEVEPEQVESFVSEAKKLDGEFFSTFPQLDYGARRRKLIDMRDRMKLHERFPVPDHGLLGTADQPLPTDDKTKRAYEHAIQNADIRGVTIQDLLIGEIEPIFIGWLATVARQEFDSEQPFELPRFENDRIALRTYLTEKGLLLATTADGPDGNRPLTDEVRQAYEVVIGLTEYKVIPPEYFHTATIPPNRTASQIDQIRQTYINITFEKDDRGLAGLKSYLIKRGSFEGGPRPVEYMDLSTRAAYIAAIRETGISKVTPEQFRAAYVLPEQVRAVVKLAREEHGEQPFAKLSNESTIQLLRELGRRTPRPLAITVAEIWHEQQTDLLLLLGVIGLAFVAFAGSLVGTKPWRVTCRYVSVEGFALTAALGLCFWTMSSHPHLDWTGSTGPPINGIVGFTWFVVIVFLAGVATVYIARWADLPDGFYMSLLVKVGLFLFGIWIVKLAKGEMTTLIASVMSLFWLLFVGTVAIVSGPRVRRRVDEEADDATEHERPKSEDVETALALTLTRLRDRYKECVSEIEEIYPADDFETDLDDELGEKLTANDVKEAERRLKSKIDRYRVHERVRGFYHEQSSGENHFPYEEIEVDMQRLKDEAMTRSELATLESKLISKIEQRVGAIKREGNQPVAVEDSAVSEDEARRTIEEDVRTEYSGLIGDFEDEIQQTIRFRLENWKRNQIEKTARNDGSGQG